MSLIQYHADDNSFRVGFQDSSSLVVFNFPIQETAYEQHSNGFLYNDRRMNGNYHTFRSDDYLLTQNPQSDVAFNLQIWDLGNEQSQPIYRGKLVDPTLLQTLIRPTLKSEDVSMS